MRTSEFLIESEPAPGEVQYLEDRIYEFNSTATGITDGEWLAIFVRDEAGRIVAGICGNTWGGWLEIRQLWVEEARRKQGLGTRLLGAAEQEARRRGCRNIFLSTFSFQAPAFYARHGFEVVAVVDDHPRGHKNMLMRKRLGGTHRPWFMSALLEAGWAPGAVFVLHVLASRVFSLYTTYPHVDIAMHILGGVAIAYLFWRAGIRAADAGAIGRVNRTGVGVIVFGLTCAAAVFWEFAEYLSDRCAGTRAQLGLEDTLGDMLSGIVGGTALIAAMCLRSAGAPGSRPASQPGIVDHPHQGGDRGSPVGR